MPVWRRMGVMHVGRLDADQRIMLVGDFQHDGQAKARAVDRKRSHISIMSSLKRPIRPK